MPTNIEQSAITIPADFSEYSITLFRPPVRTFLSNHKCNVSLNEDVYLTTKRTPSYPGDGESTMGRYVESILLSHSNQYEEILNEETSERLKQPLIPDGMSSK